MMTKQWLDRLVSSSGIVVLAGILLLAAQGDVPEWAILESSVSARVSCVLPERADDPPVPSASSPETIPPDCDASASYPHRSAWMTC